MALLATHLSVIANAQTLTANQETRREIELELEETPGATQYEVEVTRISKKEATKPLTFKMKKPLWKANLKPGHFQMRLRSYDERGVAGHWNEPQDFTIQLPTTQILSPKPNEQVKTKEDEKYNLQISWKPVPSAKYYKLNVHTKSGDFTKDYDGDVAQTEIKMPVANEYMVEVTAFTKDDEAGEVTKSNFALIGKELNKVDIFKPDEEYPAKVEWKKVQYSENYEYMLQQKGFEEKAKWKILQKSSTTNDFIAIAPNSPKGYYKLQVRAKANLREPSPITSVDFKYGEAPIKQRKPAAVEESKIKLSDYYKRKTPYFAVASYLITMMNYTGINKETSKKVSYSAVGGTGRIGFGFEPDSSRFAYLGIVDLSGFTIGSQNFTFASVELSSFYKINLADTAELRILGGAFMRELPETSGNADGTGYVVSKLSSLGPMLGAEYRSTITPKFGYSVHATSYFSVLGTSTPNGKDSRMTASYHVGVLGSMRIMRDMLGFAGYEYRNDSGAYAARPGDVNDPNTSSLASQGDENTVSITGHYLNLILEYNF